MKFNDDNFIEKLITENFTNESEKHHIRHVISMLAKTIGGGAPREFEPSEKFLIQQFQHHLTKSAGANGYVSKEHVQTAYKRALQDFRTGSQNASQLIQKTPTFSRAGVYRENNNFESMLTLINEVNAIENGINFGTIDNDIIFENYKIIDKVKHHINDVTVKSKSGQFTLRNINMATDPDHNDPNSLTQMSDKGKDVHGFAAGNKPGDTDNLAAAGMAHSLAIDDYEDAGHIDQQGSRLIAIHGHPKIPASEASNWAKTHNKSVQDARHKGVDYPAVNYNAIVHTKKDKSHTTYLIPYRHSDNKLMTQFVKSQMKGK